MHKTCREMDAVIQSMNSKFPVDEIFDLCLWIEAPEVGIIIIILAASSGILV